MNSAGVVTLYHSQNYGAFLQGYAMQTSLEKLGYQSEFIRLQDSEIKDLIFMIKTKNLPLAFFRFRQYLKYRTERHLLHLSLKGSRVAYTAVIVGSDTLWDVQNPTILPKDEFLGKNLEADKIIAYAPSANMTTAADFRAVYTQENPYESFCAIGVRDAKTQNLVRDITGSLPPIVCDPTLLLDRCEYPVSKPQFSHRYILVYGYSFKQEEQEQIQMLAKKHGLVTVSIGLFNKWCDYNTTATVSEFLGYIEKADFVCTGTFHGTIFTTIFEKKSVVFARENYKVLDIIAKLGIENRNASDCLDRTVEIAETELDYDKIEKQIEGLREQSLTFLKEALRC